MKQGIVRSIRLFKSFLVEQTQPEVFYGELARDSANLIEQYGSLIGKTLVDVGAGPHQFAREFAGRGAVYVPVDLDSEAPSLSYGGAAADAQSLPFADNSMDVTFSSNLIEHVPNPSAVANELVRVTKPDGLVFIAYTNWFSPWGGHETSPWHWFGGRYAIRRYTRKHGFLPKNRVHENLFPVSVSWGIDWAHAHPSFDVVECRPRYLPKWAKFLVFVPGLREVVTWNLLLILRKR
ncbi:MAG: class I SAM-dependent methyltransferase [Actinomycetales bacterium]|nr:class I SAM-dependent methyltransferase [Actinomycetales bacterium]